MRAIVVYAKPGRQAVIPVNPPAGATVQRVIELSGLLHQFPEINLERQKVGVFGKFIALDAPVEDGMRIEIYRPITADPATIPRRQVPKPGAS
jgi:putative ubiquitin-RnfH superfamily antitoxin RatB of RatAB toxin-antitoxin module